MESEDILKKLFAEWALEPVAGMEKIPGSGSGRQYYRLKGRTRTAIGVYNHDARENRAFLSFTESLRECGLPVPEIFAALPEEHVYLQQDLGDTTLFAFLTTERGREGDWTPAITDAYRKVFDWLPIFQVRAAEKIIYADCYPRPAFDRQSMMWDLNYFKYYFLKLARIPFDEQALEEDFVKFTDFLLEANDNFFLYRDFQSRNIMMINREPWFIDYQGGRRGPLQYDVASLLTDAKADIPFEVRRELLNYYLDRLEEIRPTDREKFLKYYYGFALIRILQAMGAYGFRGYYENKPHFLQSIPYALRNLKYLRENGKIGFGLDTLMRIIDQMVSLPQFAAMEKIHAPLTVTIHSFSYRKEIPSDPTGNGGGFVFDCRALPNPGRYEEFRALTGKDEEVIRFLKKEAEVDVFLNHVSAVVDQSVRNYIERGFSHLMVSFGCTGGQHRSVYCAEEMGKYLSSKYNITLEIVHHESNDPGSGPGNPS